MTDKYYINSLTPMRGVAALWVVLFHIDVCIYYRHLGALIPRELTGIFSKGYLWVDFFFLLSGFIIAHVYGEQLSRHAKWPATKHYLWARFSRIYPLHLFTLLLLVLMSSIAGYFLPQLIDDSWQMYFAWSAVPSNIFLTNAMNQHVYLSWNIVSWSIGAEWWTYVAAIIFLIALYKRNLWKIAIYIALAFSCLSYLVLVLPEKNLDITFNYGFFRCFFEFIIGVGLYEFYRHRSAEKWLAKDSIFIILILFVLIIFHWRMYDLIIIPVFSLMILAVAYNRSAVYRILSKPLFQYLGDISYSIYLMHSIWFMVFWFGLPQLRLATGMQIMPGFIKLMFVALFLSLTLISAHVAHRYVEVAGRKLLGNFFKNNLKSKGY